MKISNIIAICVLAVCILYTMIGCSYSIYNNNYSKATFLLIILFILYWIFLDNYYEIKK